MDYSKFITFLILALLSTPVFSTAVDLSNQSNFAKSSSGLMWATKASGAPTGQLITSNRASVPFQYNVPNGQALVPVNGTREANISASRLGKAATNFAKKVGPIAVGLAVADLVCDLSNICDDGSGNWEQTFQGFEEYPLTIPSTGSSFTGNTPGTTFPSAQLSCSDCARIQAHAGSCSDFEYHDNFLISGNTYQCRVHRTSNPAAIFNAGNTLQTDGCPDGYSSSGSTCNLDSAPRPPTDQDWIDAETALNDEQFIQPLFDAGEPLPVDQPDPFPPVNTITGSTTKTIKDGDGNIIGTEVTEKTLTVTDTSDANSPNLVDVKETTKVSTYDQNNNLTGESTSVSEPPPPPTETQNEDIEFDNVNDTNLDTHDVDLEFTPQSWGSGTCPPDIDIATTLGGTQTLSMQPVCDFATSVNPIVLVMSSLIAMYLVSSVRLD